MPSYGRLSKKPLLFRSFTGLTVKEIDDIYKKEMAKRYDKYETQRISKRKGRERRCDAGRPFRLDIKNRFLMLLVYHRPYITFTLVDVLFDLDQSSVCRDMRKIEPLVRECMPIPQRMHKTTKKLRTPEEVEKCFPGFIAFTDCTEQQIPRPKNNEGRRRTIQARRKGTP